MSWEIKYAALVLLSTTIDYFSSHKIYRTQNALHRKLYLAFSVTANLGILFTFKYYNFFIKELGLLLQSMDISFAPPLFQLLLPVGISFYTFQTISHSIDVYRGQIVPEPHFGKFALFVTYFPQLVAGPIERASKLLPQLQELNARFEAERIISGLQKAAWGFFKKIVIADRLAEYVDIVYSDPSAFGWQQHLLATYFFSIQIYCDFSGYSDIAIGVSRIFGIDLMENFKIPYLARNIQEFWSKWHISLTTWFRDYVYIPLGGNRKGKWRTYANISAVFLISAIWHGANWTFVVWGVLHIVYMMAYLLWNGKKATSPATTHFSIADWGWIIVNFHLAALAWIFFRAETVSSGWDIVSSIASMNGESGIYIGAFGAFSMLITSMLIIVLIYMEYLLHFSKINLEKHHWKNTLLFAGMVFFILAFGVFKQQSFIYFQF